MDYSNDGSAGGAGISFKFFSSLNDFDFAGGAVDGGTVTSLEVLRNGAVAYEIDDLNFSLNDLFVARADDSNDGSANSNGSNDGINVNRLSCRPTNSSPLGPLA